MNSKRMANDNRRSLPDNIILDSLYNILISQLKTINRLKYSVLDKQKMDDIHDLRTTLRRIIITFKIYEHLTHTKTKKIFIKGIKTLKKELGHIRNIDEAIVFLKKKTKLPIDHKLHQELLTLRNSEAKRIKKQIQLFNKLPTKITHNPLNKIEHRRIGDRNRKKVMNNPSSYCKRNIKLILKLISNSTLKENHKQRHKMRISLRKLRYFMEAISVITEKDNKSELNYLKKFQTVLGHINDITVFRELYHDIKLSLQDRKLINKILACEEEKSMEQLVQLIEKWNTSRLYLAYHDK